MSHPIWENIFRRKQQEKDLTTWLSENPLFAGLSSKELQFVESIVHVRHYRENEPVFKVGEPGVGMFIIISGSIKVKASGKEVLLGPGDFFGELALVEQGSRRVAEATAGDDSKLMGFFRPDLEEIKDRSPSIGVKILSGLAEVLGSRLREAVSLNEKLQ